MPGWYTFTHVSFSFPGTASVLIPKDGTEKECITSADVISNLTAFLAGITSS